MDTGHHPSSGPVGGSQVSFDVYMSDTDRCPLCEAPNQCGLAAGQSDCWCFTTAIPADVLARVPDADQSRRCVCESCATRASAAVPDSPRS
ncbi:MAG: cysteine-rich CWC family protein [Vicinamibacterales bacterium]